MLKSIALKNYRCFRDSQLNIRELTIIVGKNNSGKSTLIEAMRIVAEAGKKSKYAKYTQCPTELNYNKYDAGFKIDNAKLKIDLRGIVYFYQEDICAQIVAVFDDGCKIVILADQYQVFALLYDNTSKNIQTKGKAAKYSFDSVDILPQIGLIRDVEPIYVDSTIVRDKSTYLSSLHFRNEIARYRTEYFDKFKKLAEETWKGLKIDDLIIDEANYRLLVRDGDFTTEIGMMGNGIQMWLQIIWFICKCKGMSTIILDEPDVYMHPDMQKKILYLVNKEFSQVIIATHSIEIISEVEPRNIVTTDKTYRYLKYADSSKAVQKIVEGIGSQYNLALSRIQSAKRCLFVEGKDAKLLSKIAKKLELVGTVQISEMPCTPLGGFSRLSDAFGAAKLFFEETEGDVKCYCIVDRDYHTEDEIRDKCKSAEDNKLYLHVWRRKEIENYLINPDVFFRLSKKRDAYSDFVRGFEEIINSFYDVVFDGLSTFFRVADKNLEIKTCNQKARETLNRIWTTLEGKISIIPGKDALREIRSWMQREYNATCTDDCIINEIRQAEFDPEVVSVLNMLQGK